jgi:hypothetical protein
MRKVAWNRKTVSVALLAVVLPVSLAVVFQLTRGITISGTRTLEAVTWSFQRPSDPEINVLVNDTLEAFYDGDGESVKHSVLVWRYDGNWFGTGTDCLIIGVQMNATVGNSGAWISSVSLTLRDSQPSKIHFREVDIDIENLTLSDYAEGYKKASVRLNSVNHPNKVHTLFLYFPWEILTSESESHQMEITCETTYYNGTAFNKVVQPFQLNILGAEE